MSDEIFNSALFLLSCVIALISLYPDKAFRNARSTRLSDRESENQAPWEMMMVPGTPGTTGGLKSPTTPRTTAFNQLSGKGKAPVRMGNKGIPLRHHIAMGEETYAGSSRGRHLETLRLRRCNEMRICVNWKGRKIVKLDVLGVALGMLEFWGEFPRPCIL